MDIVPGSRQPTSKAGARRWWAGVAVVTLIASLGWTAPSTGQDSIEKDYAGELPRIPPTEPQAALSLFRVAEGFRIEQVACEPLVVDPIAFCFDENGRLFVVEMRGYSEDEADNLGRIRLLDDTDGDGRFDRSHVFAEGFSWPTALLCYDGGLFVGAAPEIVYLKDTDGDNRADQRELVFSGFGRSNVQGLLNSFRWGLDNLVHGATSSSGASLSASGAGTSGGEPLVLRGRDFAFDPRQRTITPTSGGAQHGLSFNRWGEKFVCSNSDHIQHVTFEDRYVARNPFFAAPSPRVSIAADGPQADVFRSSPVEPWRIVRTRLRVQGLVPGPVEGGGTPAGYFTGATGVTIYLGNAWPDEALDWAIIGDVGSNLIHRKRLHSDGVTYVARRFDEKTEFIRSTDIWFRPVQFGNAPDGALYVADMYREVIEHPQSLPPIIKKHLDLTSGRDRGRIYRIVPDGFEQPALPRLGEAESAELVALLGHENGWHRETAARLLYERQDRSVAEQLEMMLRTEDLPEGRVRALYALDGLGMLRAGLIAEALQDTHPRVRQHALRVGETLVEDSAELRDRYCDLVSDSSLNVRYQLAFSLGALSSVARHRALADLVGSDGDDPYFRIAIFSSLAQGAGAVLADLAADEGFRQRPQGREWLAALAAQIGKQQRPEDVATTLQVLTALGDTDPAAVEVIVSGLAAPRDSRLARRVAAATGGQSEKMLAEVLDNARKLVEDSSVASPRRVEAVYLLRLGTYPSQREILADLLDPSQPADIQEAAVKTLAGYSDDEVAQLLVERWGSLSPQLRRHAGDVLFSRDVWIPHLLNAVESSQIAARDLDPSRWRLLAGHGDPQIQSAAEKILASLGSRSRASLVDQYRKALSLSGDPTRGAAVFKKTCASCHQLGTDGYALGPNLAAMQNRGPEAVLVNVLDPNREVNPQYLNYAVQTTDGRLLTGMISSETATSVTLDRGENAQDTVLRVDIDALQSTGVSIMPEGLEKQIDEQAMADLLAFLATLR